MEGGEGEGGMDNIFMCGEGVCVAAEIRSPLGAAAPV
jgi:hypothetical protein